MSDNPNEAVLKAIGDVRTDIAEFKTEISARLFLIEKRLANIEKWVPVENSNLIHS